MNYIGSADYYTIRVPRISVDELEKLWRQDPAAPPIDVGHEAAGISAIVTVKSPMILRRAADSCDVFLRKEMEFAVQFCIYDDDVKYRAFLWSERTTY